MINSNAFDYINVVDRALDASYLRETVIANNIANVDTPYYKRKDVNFQDVLDDAIDSAKYKTILAIKKPEVVSHKIMFYLSNGYQ